MKDFVRWVDGEPRHYDEFARLFPELGLDDPVPSFEVWAQHMAADTLFLEEHGVVVAYAWFYALGDQGFVRHVIVDRAARGRGLGAQVMRVIADRLRDRGCWSWQLNVRPDNLPAVALYRSLGFATDFSTWVVRISRECIAGFTRPPFAAFELDPTYDAHAEVEFALTPGLLNKLRTGRDVRVFAVQTDQRLVALARFDPHFPGAFPFFARDDQSACALLEAMVAFTPADRAWLQLVIERDPRLASAVIEAGAVPMYEIHHMVASIS